MKVIWTTLISLAFLLVVAAVTLYLLIHYSVFSGHELNNEPLFEPTLEGYKNHQLVQFSPSNEFDIKKLVELQDRLNLIPWSQVLRPGWPVIFQVPPSQVRHLSLSTEALKMPFIQLTSNMQDYLTNRKNVISEFKLDKSDDFNLNKYHYYTEIERYLNKLGEENTDRLIVNTYGNSVENRQLYYVRIFKTIDEAKEPEKPLKEKKVVILECGAHSREWLSPAVCLHVIDSLIHDKDSQQLLQEYEFYILPLINPDGYAYSWTRDRMWRKNRRRFANNCYGVDLNRNFNIGFNTSEIPENIHLIKDLEDLDIWANNTRVRRFLESSINDSIQCSNLYPGERPFSENETFYLKRLIDRFTIRPNVYISLHSYSQMWLYPFGTKNLTSPVEEKLDKYAKIGVEHLQRAGINQTEWKFGSAYNIMYNAGGISIDWAHKDVGIDLVYTLEMRDSGTFGFLLPEDQIEPAFKEAWAGLSAVLTAYAEDLNNSTVITTEPTTIAI